MEQAQAISVSRKPETLLLECKNILTQSEGLVPLNEEAYKNDADLQSFVATLEGPTKALLTKVKENGGVSLDDLDKMVEIITCVGKTTADAVVAYKSGMITMKDNSYKPVVRGYLEYSLEYLNFCNDLEKFLNTARRSHSHIEQKIQECINLGSNLDAGREDARKISNMLKNLMASNVNDHSGEKLLEKSFYLLKEQKQMLENVNAAQTKLGKEEERLKGWRKLTHYLLLGIKFISAVVVTLVTAFFPILPVDSSTAVEVSMLVVDLTTQGVSIIANLIEFWIEKLLKKLRKNQNTVNSIEIATDFSMKEMGDLQVLIEAVSTQVEALLGIGIDFANGENIRPAIKDIMHYLKKFLGKIEALEKKKEKCSSMIQESREAILM